jgi:tRNA (guanosine-2'-O-)-methyltransferase
MHGIGASLNVSVAVGVILAEAERQRLAAGFYAKSRLSPEERDRTLFEWSYPELAERCRQQGRPYPALTPNGQLASNPSIDISTVSQ